MKLDCGVPTLIKEGFFAILGSKEITIYEPSHEIYQLSDLDCLPSKTVSNTFLLFKPSGLRYSITTSWIDKERHRKAGPSTSMHSFQKSPPHQGSGLTPIQSLALSHLSLSVLTSLSTELWPWSGGRSYSLSLSPDISFATVHLVISAYLLILFKKRCCTNGAYFSAI